MPLGSLSAWIPWLLLAAVVVPLAIALRRANELFVLRADGGTLRPIRGRIPPALLRDLADVVFRRGPGEATKARDGLELRGLAEDGAVVVRARPPLDAADAQRVRNVVGSWPLHRVRTAPRIGG